MNENDEREREKWRGEKEDVDDVQCAHSRKNLNNSRPAPSFILRSSPALSNVVARVFKTLGMLPLDYSDAEDAVCIIFCVVLWLSLMEGKWIISSTAP